MLLLMFYYLILKSTMSVVNDVKLLGFGANKEFLRCLQCKKVVLLKHEDRTHEQKELRWGHENYILVSWERVRDSMPPRNLEAKFLGP